MRAFILYLALLAAGSPGGRGGGWEGVVLPCAQPGRARLQAKLQSHASPPPSTFHAPPPPPPAPQPPLPVR